MSASQARLRSVVLCSDGGALRLSVHEHCRYDVMVHYLRVWGFLNISKAISGSPLAW
jgi:hypothetical protein